jgi:hypothetical protein
VKLNGNYLEKYAGGKTVMERGGRGAGRHGRETENRKQTRNREKRLSRVRRIKDRERKGNGRETRHTHTENKGGPGERGEGGVAEGE